MEVNLELTSTNSSTLTLPFHPTPSPPSPPSPALPTFPNDRAASTVTVVCRLTVPSAGPPAASASDPGRAPAGSGWARDELVELALLLSAEGGGYIRTTKERK